MTEAEENTLEKAIDEIYSTLQHAWSDFANKYVAEQDQQYWEEITRLARLGAMVEDMPKGTTLFNRGTGGYRLGDSWHVNDDDALEGEWGELGRGLTPMQALEVAAKKPRWQRR